MNHIINSGYTYDVRGNLTSDGVNTYVWDRANRLLSSGGANHAYDGMGNRVTSTVSGTTTRYLLDVQAPLTNVIAATSGANTTRYVHAAGGLLSQEDAAGDWQWLLSDGLGSIRSVVDTAFLALEHRHYEPYGNLFGGTMNETPFGFTGEWRDSVTAMYYLRARYYAPGMGTFVSRDPFEGTAARSMSLNGYSWVEGNVANLFDKTGLDAFDPFGQDPCGLLRSSFRLETLSNFITIRSSAYYYPSSEIERRDFAIKELLAYYYRCECDIPHLPNVLRSYQYNLRMFINGYNVRQDTLSNILIWNCLDMPLQAYNELVQFVLPIRDSTGYEYSIRLINNNLPIGGCNNRECSFNDLLDFNAASWGFIYAASMYSGMGFGGSIIILTNGSGRFVAFAAGEAGVGIGGYGTFYGYVQTEANLDQLAGLALGLSGGLQLSGAVSVSLDGLCNFTLSGGGVGVGVAINISNTQLLLDGDINYILQNLGGIPEEVRQGLIQVPGANSASGGGSSSFR
jgi:RHS repeat-associated protein